MQKPTIGVFFGSRSTEHDVSIITALAAVIKPLELSGKYTVVPVYIAKDGRWYSGDELKDVAMYATGKIEAWRRSRKPLSVCFDQGLVLRSGGLTGRSQRIDIAFPALHGTHGEDGEMMGLFELAGVPYVGCGTAASAVAMDKVLTKLVVQSAGIPVTTFRHFSQHEFETDPADCITKINRGLHYPLFVKPAHLGSSIGITRVVDPKHLQDAIEVALHYDDKVIIEEGVSDLTEVTLPILGNDQPQPALLEQPLRKPDDFFDFDTKYMNGGKKTAAADQSEAGQKGAQGYSQIPAELSDELTKKALDIGLRVYTVLGCSGTARVDMLIDNKTGAVYCNEVNPLPGSLYEHNWSQAGISDIELVTRLVDLAIERHEQRAKRETVFATNFLQQF